MNDKILYIFLRLNSIDNCLKLHITLLYAVPCTKGLVNKGTGTTDLAVKYMSNEVYSVCVCVCVVFGFTFLYWMNEGCEV